MSNFRIFKETTLPGSLQPHSIYLVAPTGGPSDYLEIYVTNAAGTATRKTLTRAQTQAMIDASVAASAGNTTVIVDDIAARNALIPTNAQRVYVVNATGDATVNTGGAEYMWRSATNAWVKLSETESQDLVLAWANITGRPNKTVAEIEDAVNKRHTHANATQLDKVGEDGNGNLTYGGVRPRIAWDSTGW